VAGNVTTFLRVLHEYALCDRYPELAQYEAMAQMGRLSEGMAKALLSQLEPLIVQQERRPNLLNRAPDNDELHPDGPPDLVLGRLAEGHDVPLGLSLQGNMNTLILGRSGVGKTTCLKALLKGILERNAKNPQKRVSFIVFDVKGGDFFDLAEESDECVIYHYEKTLRVGLQPQTGVPPNVQINEIAQVLANRLGLVVSATCLASIMRFCVSALNSVPTGLPTLYPTPELILDVAKHAPLTLFATKPDYGKTLIQKLEALVQETGPMFQTFSGLDVDRDIVGQGKCAIVDVCGLGPTRAIPMEILATQALVGRQWHFVRRDSVDLVFAGDEGDEDADSRNDAASPRIGPLPRLYKQGREAGLAGILSLSALGPTARQIRAAAAHIFNFSVSDADSLYEARKSLVLRDGSEMILPGLRPGECLYRGPNWPHAALGAVDYLSPSRVPRPDQYDVHPFVPSKRLHELPPVIEALDRLIARHRSSNLSKSKKESKGTKASLSENARNLMTLWAVHPFTPVVRLWDELGKPSPSVQRNVRRELTNLKLCRFAEVRAGQRNMLFMELQQQGWSLLDRTPPKVVGKGRTVHRHMCHFAKWMEERRGNKAILEWPVPGTSHPTDVGVRKDGAWHAYEIADTCTSNLPDHLRACFIDSSEVATVTIVAPQKAMLKRIEQMLDPCLDLMPFRSRTVYLPLEDIIRELWP